MFGFSKKVCMLLPPGLVLKKNVVLGCTPALPFIRSCGAPAVAVVKLDWFSKNGPGGAATVVGLVALRKKEVVPAAAFGIPGSIRFERLPANDVLRP